jgi:toxin-antitoxin system PIN domain toxin
MSTFLFDANVLIALVAREHVHHERVTRWVVDVRHFALCPIVEGALIRFTLRLGVSVSEARQSLRLVHERDGFQFWPDSLSFADASLAHVGGHRQVTDAYLVSLARSRTDCKLATLDTALAGTRPDSVLLASLFHAARS